MTPKYSIPPWQKHVTYTGPEPDQSSEASASLFLKMRFVVMSEYELDFHQILYRQILRLKGRVAFRWVVLCCQQSDYLSDKKDSRTINEII